LELLSNGSYFDSVDHGETITVLNPDTLDELHPDIKNLIEYFWEKAEKKARPSRKDLVPSEILSLIPNLIILEPRYDGTNIMAIYIRLMGTEMVKAYGEQTGKMLSDLPSKKISKRVFDTCSLAVKTKEIVVGSVSSFDNEKEFLKLVKVKIPLFDDLYKPDKVTQIISLIIFSTEL
jgi:hypothetical protein